MYRGETMLRGNRIAIALCMSASFIVSCGGTDPGARVTQLSDKKDDEKVLNLYFWADYLAPDTISSFEKLTGIKVHVSYFETNETLEVRMLTGNSGFDVVVPTAPFFQRQIRGGAYLLLDKKTLPNLVNLDPATMARVALNDPGNEHGVVYAWTKYGIGYNAKMVAEALPNVLVDSWRLIFDPAFAAKLSKCGISTIDAPAGVVRLVLKYLGKNPNAPGAQDLADATSVLMKIRPYIRNIDSSNYTEAMANGDICIALGYSGDFVQARKRAEEARTVSKLTM
jgi:putrescine transport system substrate-binding protein